MGSSRGGKIINDRMQLLNLIPTGGQIHDREIAIELFANIEIEDKKVLADKAYKNLN